VARPSVSRLSVCCLDVHSRKLTAAPPKRPTRPVCCAPCGCWLARAAAGSSGCRSSPRRAVPCTSTSRRCLRQCSRTSRPSTPTTHRPAPALALLPAVLRAHRAHEICLCCHRREAIRGRHRRPAVLRLPLPRDGHRPLCHALLALHRRHGAELAAAYDFQSYALAVALACWALGFWVRASREGKRPWLLYAPFVACCCLVLLTHLLPYLLILAVCAIDLAGSAMSARGADSAVWAQWRREALAFAAACVPLLFLWSFTRTNRTTRRLHRPRTQSVSATSSVCMGSASSAARVGGAAL
jgi:hypothetical protein